MRWCTKLGLSLFLLGFGLLALGQAEAQPRAPSRPPPQRFLLATAVPGTKPVTGACGATPVFRSDTGRGDAKNEAICEYGFYTAGHCFFTDADTVEGGSAGSTHFRTLTLSRGRSQPLTLNRLNVEVVLGPGYLGRERRFLTPNGREVSSRVISPDDEALFFFSASCRFLSDPDVSVLPAGRGRSFQRGDRLEAVSKQGILVGIVAGYTDTGDQWQVNLSPLAPILPGDSGSPIYNSKHELVGSLSRKVTRENESQPYGYSFDPKGVDWAKGILADKLNSVKRERSQRAASQAVGSLTSPRR